MNSAEKERVLTELLKEALEKNKFSVSSVEGALRKICKVKNSRLEKVGERFSSYYYSEVNKGLTTLFQELKSFSFDLSGNPFFLRFFLSNEKEKETATKSGALYYRRLMKLTEKANFISPFFGTMSYLELDRLFSELKEFQLTAVGKRFLDFVDRLGLYDATTFYFYPLGRAMGASLLSFSQTSTEAYEKVEDKIYSIVKSPVEEIPLDFTEGMISVLAENGYKAKSRELVRALFEKAVSLVRGGEAYLRVAGENLLREFSSSYLKEVFNYDNRMLSCIVELEKEIEEKSIKELGDFPYREF